MIEGKYGLWFSSTYIRNLKNEKSPAHSERLRPFYFFLQSTKDPLQLSSFHGRLHGAVSGQPFSGLSRDVKMSSSQVSGWATQLTFIKYVSVLCSVHLFSTLNVSLSLPPSQKLPHSREVVLGSVCLPTHMMLGKSKKRLDLIKRVFHFLVRCI